MAFIDVYCEDIFRSLVSGDRWLTNGRALYHVSFNR
jgi:hypothetical protein